MIAFVLHHSTDEWSPYTMIGVYSTKQLAEVARGSHQDKMREKHVHWADDMSWRIDEVQVDKIDWI